MLGLLAGAGSAASAAPHPLTRAEGLDGLASALSALAPDLATERWAQDRYVLAAASDGLGLRPVPDAKMFPMGAFAPGVDIGPVGRIGPCVLIRYRLAPDARLPPHDHPNYSVATIGLRGEARVEQFEIEGEAPPYANPGGFRVRRILQRCLGRGDVVTLSPRRDNIHTFRAGPSGAEFFDLTTPHGPDEGFSYLRLAERGAIGDVVAASWWRP
jgi:hypothetical protein